MKPAFALDFRDETVRLLHRSGRDWQLVGAVPLDTSDLDEALNYLRSTALGLSPKGLETKLIIPEEQILYTQVHAPGPSTEERAAQVMQALAGRTPYEVGDLVFDISGAGPDVTVAVIAKETLAEAEAFATEHRFNPVSFVAAPEDNAFQGEPWFGVTQYATNTLPSGETVERDEDAVFVIERSPIVAEPEAEAEVAPEVAEPSQPESEEERAAEVDLPDAETVEDDYLPEAEPEAAPEAEDYLPEAEAEVFEEPPEEAPEVYADLPEEELAESVAEAEIDDEPQIAETKPTAPAQTAFSVDAVKPAPSLTFGVFEPQRPAPPRVDEADDRELVARLSNTLARPIEQPAPVVQPKLTRPPLPEVAEAPMALDVAPEDGGFDEVQDEPQGAKAIQAAISAQSARVTENTIDDGVPQPAATGAFNSRRQDNSAAPALGAAATLGKAAALGKTVTPPAKPLAAGVKPALTATKPTPLANKAAPAKAAQPTQALGKTAKSSLRGMGAMVGAAAASQRGKVELPKASAVAAASLDAPAANPAAPARKSIPKGPGGFALREPVRGKPRYLGLILTVVLLFLLAMVAAWSSYNLGWNAGEPDAVQTAGTEAVVAPTGLDASADDLRADLQNPEALADGQGDEDLANATAAEAPATTAETAPDTQQTQATLAQPSAKTDGTQDEIFLAAMDAPPEAPDPLSLPLPEARGDPLPAAQPAPPPFGTVYQFNPDGSILATPEGIITPEGVLLKAGRPAIVPKPRSPAIAPVAAAPEAPVVFADPALAGKEPKQRPAGLAPPVVEDQGALTPSLAPQAGTRIASLRPQARPGQVLAAGDAAREASAAATLSASASLAVAQAADVGVSPLAIAISRKPAPRPRDMSRAVDAALQVAMRQPVPAPEPEPEVVAQAPKAAKAAIQAPAAPEDDGEPEVAASSKKKTPLRTTVAKQATFKNAISLSKTSLIGLYGTSSKRYALVRQSNGKYKKLRVGDRIDGGTVAAITANELRYQKGGRLLVLSMPTG